MRARLFPGLALVAAGLCSGCAWHPKAFPVREVAPGIFLGPKPWKQAHFEKLRAVGVRSIFSLEQMPWDIWPERRQARRNGLEYRNVPIMASPLAPPEKRVRQALSILHDPSLRPIFVHCFLSEDRTSFILGLYRIYFQDWTPQAAFQEMLRLGFHVRPTLRGFDAYFWSHTDKPDWVRALRSAEQHKPP